jgi:hypothetical protein
MKWLALSLAALVTLFVALEWGAAPPSDLMLGSGERPTRHVHTGSRFAWRPPEVNDACRNICEPHCADRWGTSALPSVLCKGCFLICIDEACEAR